MAPSPGFSSGLLILSAHTSLLTFQILQKCTNITQKTVILTAQCHLISVLFRRQKRVFFSQMPPSSFLAGPAPPQKLCSKCTEIKNQKSAVIALFEITIIKTNYNLIFK
ncbi:hypothetical protein PO909_013457 [Leuciscus waleckii]